MMNRMINRNLPSGLLAALLCLAPPVFTACQEEPAKITITMVSDYSQLIEAINNVSRSLSEKVELVETALLMMLLLNLVKSRQPSMVAL